MEMPRVFHDLVVHLLLAILFSSAFIWILTWLAVLCDAKRQPMPERFSAALCGDGTVVAQQPF